MKITLTKHQAADQLMADPHAKWTYNGSHALVAYLMEMERESGEEMEFDRTEIRCDWHEYGSVFEACNDKGVEVDPEDGEEEEEYRERLLEALRDDHYVIEFSGGVIVGS